MYIPRTPKFIQQIFSKAVWNIPNKSNDIFITFDDGPHPIVTSFVIDQLKNFNAKATFFCVGANVQKHPEVIDRIISNGHTIGNHTFNHPNGLICNNNIYFENVNSGYEITQSKLFRPPYGKLKPSQYQYLSKQYKIVMWDVLGEDYSPKMRASECISKITKQTKSGSIIVLHDSAKCFEKLQIILPAVLEKLSQKGFQFKAIPRDFEN